MTDRYLHDRSVKSTLSKCAQYEAPIQDSKPISNGTIHLSFLIMDIWSRNTMKAGIASNIQSKMIWWRVKASVVAKTLIPGIMW